MTTDTVITLGNEALLITVTIAAPLLMAALAAGLVVSLFQAATQINEVTLSFIPKLLALVAALYLTGPWILGILLDYTTRMITEVVPGAMG